MFTVQHGWSMTEGTCLEPMTKPFTPGKMVTTFEKRTNALYNTAMDRLN
jgi:hypothetical protein